MTAARLYRWFARDAEAKGHESPLVVGHFCDVCDNLDHLYCCDPDLALCGTDLSDVELTAFDHDDNPDLCVVCHDLEFAICRRCGS